MALFSLVYSLTCASSTFSSSTKSALLPNIPRTKKKIKKFYFLPFKSVELLSTSFIQYFLISVKVFSFVIS